MEEVLQIGIITSPHGVKGEAKVFPTTDDVKRFKRLKEVLLDSGRERITLEIEGVKFYKQMAILKFKGIDTPEDVAKYRQAGLYVTRENAVKLGKDEYFIADLIGMVAVNEDGQCIGSIEDVMQTGANDVYVIRMTDGRELLLPAIRQCILDVDLQSQQMKVHILEGLV
ncbi:MAG: ribosome maturation factor RimM [bacterium]|nr:ribosome maturation factor RimM [bacterium]MCM1376266.1 ribosome maturation factor RimM [Muribaculum sp.]